MRPVGRPSSARSTTCDQSVNGRLPWVCRLIESCILLGLSHSASKGLKFGKLKKKRLSTQAQDNAVVRPIRFTH